MDQGIGGTGDTSWLFREPPLPSDRHDELDPARGIIAGFLMSVAFWVTVWLIVG